MKEATGELSMTVITIIAIVAIARIIGILMPLIKEYINNTWDNLANESFSVEIVEVMEESYY